MRPIDADALPIRKAYIVDEAGFGATFYVVDVENIDCAPTIDAVPVVHGRWIPTYHKYYNRDGECMIADEWHCSECGIRLRQRWNFCPKCGAKMDGKADV